MKTVIFLRQQLGLKRNFRLKRFAILVILSTLFILISCIPLRITITKMTVPVPQGIFVLGGDGRRMEFAAHFWHDHPDLDIWVSDFPELQEWNLSSFHKLGVPKSKLHYDGCPTDTVTNFTCIVDDFSKQKLWHFYLITSAFHIKRSRAIATIVFGSRGIVVTPISVPSPEIQAESIWHVLRDCFRSSFWVFTGKTGASFNPRLGKI